MISRSRRSRIPILLSLLFKVLFYLSSSSYFFLPNCLIRSRQSSIEKLNRIESFQRDSRKGGTKGAHEITSGRYLIEKARPYAYLVRRRRPTGFLRYAAAVATRRAASRRVVARAYLPVPVCPPIFQSTRVCVCVRSGARYEIPSVPLRRPSSRPAAPSCFRFKSIVLFCAFLILISFFKTIYIFHIIYFLYDVYSICVLLLHYVIYLLY